MGIDLPQGLKKNKGSNPAAATLAANAEALKTYCTGVGMPALKV